MKYREKKTTESIQMDSKRKAEREREISNTKIVGDL
jgi:hypothetical protein